MTPFQKLKELWSVPGYSTSEKVGAAAAGLTIAVCLLIIGPLLTIWTLNTLFPVLAIQYNIWTWLAALLLNIRLKSKFTNHKD